MRVHLINPSEVSFGTAVITPRWLYVLAAATPASFGDPHLVDESLEALIQWMFRRETLSVSGFIPRTLFAVARSANWPASGRSRGLWGNSCNPYPSEAHELGGAHAVVKGDGDVSGAGFWRIAFAEPAAGLRRWRIEASDFLPARWDLVPRKSYMWASVQTVRGCPKHCSFCSVWRTDGQRPRQRSPGCGDRGNCAVAAPRLSLHRSGRRQFLSCDAHRLAARRTAEQRGPADELKAIRAERFELMARLAELPADMIFFTQITMEAAEDTDSWMPCAKPTSRVRW